MGGPGSGGFRGYGYPPGSQSESAQDRRKVKKTRKVPICGAKRTKKWEASLQAPQRERLSALKESRRVAAQRRENVAKYRKPVRAWKKWTAKSRVTEAFALHHSRPIWLCVALKEMTDLTKERLVVCKVKRVFKTVASDEVFYGPKFQVPSLIAVPRADLWIS